MIKRLLLATIVGFLAAFLLWGFEILPGATYHYKTDIEIDAGMASPMLIRMPSGRYFLIMEYEAHDDYWYLYDYMVYADGHWSIRNNQWPLTLGISDSYEIFMLPSPTFYDCAEQRVAKLKIERLEHDVWHLQQKQDQYYEAWQDCFQELIDSGLYELDIEVSSGNVTLRSYRRK